MAIDAQEHGTKLTIRGRVVVALIVGLSIASVVFLINGIWWDCDLTQSNSICKVTWGY
jgi:Zn-dependent membrane protease YugP